MSTETRSRDFQTTLILRLCGEITTKSDGIRQKFNRRLIQNLQDAFARAGIEARVQDKWYRIDVVTEDPAAAEVARDVFGIQGVRWTRAYDYESLDDIVAIGEELFANKVAGKTFAVRTKRAGFRDQIPFTSIDVDRALGSRLVAAGGKVNLDDHEVKAGIEVRADKAFFFDEELPGVAGLPSGVEGRALALISGGFDSAVAAWSMMSRGVDLDFLFFNLAGPPQERAVKEITRAFCQRWAMGYSPKLHIVDLRPMLAEMRREVDGHYWQLLLKRLMVRAGAQICREKRLPAMITGESCGQVSSQTLLNIAAVTAPITTAVLRPLVAMNKDAIIELSRQVGTYELSSKTPEFCSLDGGPPIVDGRPHKLDEQEALVDGKLLRELVRRRQIHKVLEMDLDDEPQVQTDTIPPGSVILDLRPEHQFERWAVDDAINMPLERAIDQVGLLPKQASYLLYCEVGLKSAFLAEQMVRMGYEAYSFSGGVPKLKKVYA